MSQLGTVYATKRRRRNGKSLKPPPKDGVTKSNPSKRHRERLNAELDLLASLLPFDQNILSKLDRLSILRLSVSYLRTKSYFQFVMNKDKEENGMLPHIHAHDGYRTRELGAFEHGLLDGDTFLQALNGFLMILTCEGEVFFATHSIESYLGFHQSDIVHQSVYELVHSEDREELQRQLLWNSFLPADMSSIQLNEILAPDKALYLERSFTVRFRCLLDNTSGFLRLDIRGRIKILYGQNRKTEEPPLALFAYCTPFGPPSLLEIPHKENMFKSKHKLDFSLVSMDQRGKHALGYSDAELVNMGGYDMVHFDDMAYVASAHQELLKTGASGMIAYRYQKKDGTWQWLQTSSRLVYKNSKPDFIICTHRQLMDEEGHDLLGKRTMDFKVSYLDTGLASTYFSEADQLVVPPSGSPNSLPPPVTPTRPNRRYKTQLRDFLSTCRTKRKMQQQPQQTSPLGQVTSPTPVVEYLPDPAVAVAAAYSNLNPMYTTSPYATAADNIYMGTSVHSTNFYPVTENLFHQYRLQGVGGYYTDYHHSAAPASAYVTNGFLPYEGYAIASSKDDKWQDTGKYYSGYSSGYGSPTSTPQQIALKTPKSSPHIMEVVSCSSEGPSPVGSTVGGHSVNVSTTSGSNNSTANGGGGGSNSVTPKVELAPQDQYERQTVLMWGTQSSGVPINSIGGGGRLHNNTTTAATERSPQSTPLSNGLNYNRSHNSENESAASVATTAKWNGNASSKDAKATATPDSYQLQQHDDSGLYSSSSHTASPQHRLSNSSSNGNVGAVGGSANSNSVAVGHTNSVAEQHANTTSTHLNQQHHHHAHASPAHVHPHSHPHTHHHHHPHSHHPHTTLLHHGGSGGVSSSDVSGAGVGASASTVAHPHHVHAQHTPAVAAVAAVTAAATPHHHHHHHPHAHSHPHAHHPHHHAAHAHANGSEIILSQQHQTQQQQHHLNYAGQQQQQEQQQQQSLSSCTPTASSSSSPSCTSPTTMVAQLPIINGTTAVASTSSATAASAAAAAAAAAAYHQLAIIASPIVITTAAINLNDDDTTSGSVIPLPSINCATMDNRSMCNNNNNNNNRNIDSIHTTTILQNHHNHQQQHQHQQQQHQQHQHQHHLQHHSCAPLAPTATIANITAHTALAYAPNAYVIGSGGGGGGGVGDVGSSGAACVGSLTDTSAITRALIDQQPDGSPLLSFSEVTNTLLNQ